VIDQTINKEALFNEVKGSLFEFLVGKELSSLHGNEFLYLKSLSKDYAKVLQDQDRMIRLFYPELRSFLEASSRRMAEKMMKIYPGFKTIQLVGKASHAGGNELAEGDLLLLNDQTDEKIYLSLKISKKNSYVNSKSAGVKSFLTTYFPIEGASQVQEDFNFFYEHQYEQMARDLHELENIAYDSSFSQWKNLNKTELPGELRFELSERLIEFYRTVALRLSGILLDFYKRNPVQFLNSLKSVTGFSNPHVVQAHLFHDGHAIESIAIDILEQGLWDKMGEVCFKPTIGASVEIVSSMMTIQLRVKPMNKFTSPAVKINCAYKLTKQLT